MDDKRLQAAIKEGIRRALADVNKTAGGVGGYLPALQRAKGNLDWLVNDVGIDALGKGDMLQGLDRIIEELQDLRSEVAYMP